MVFHKQLTLYLKTSGNYEWTIVYLGCIKSHLHACTKLEKLPNRLGGQWTGILRQQLVKTSGQEHKNSSQMGPRMDFHTQLWPPCQFFLENLKHSLLSSKVVKAPTN